MFLTLNLYNKQFFLSDFKTINGLNQVHIVSTHQMVPEIKNLSLQ